MLCYIRGPGLEDVQLYVGEIVLHACGQQKMLRHRQNLACVWLIPHQEKLLLRRASILSRPIARERTLSSSCHHTAAGPPASHRVSSLLFLSGVCPWWRSYQACPRLMWLPTLRVQHLSAVIPGTTSLTYTRMCWIEFKRRRGYCNKVCSDTSRSEWYLLSLCCTKPCMKCCTSKMNSGSALKWCKTHARYIPAVDHSSFDVIALQPQDRPYGPVPTLFLYLSLQWSLSRMFRRPSLGRWKLVG